MSRRTRKLTGQTSFVDTAAGTVMHSAEQLEVGSDHTVTRIGPLDPRQKAVELPSEDRKVIHYMGSILQARKANEHRLRRQNAKPILKPQDTRKKARPAVSCTACNDLRYWVDEEGNHRDCEVCQ